MKKYFFFLTAISLLLACTPQEQYDPGSKIVHVTDLSLSHKSISIKEGESFTLEAFVIPNNADNKAVTWATTSEAIAYVDDGGKVTGIAAGNAAILAITDDGGKWANCTVNVAPNLAPSVTVGSDHVSAISAMLIGKVNLGETVASDFKVGFQYSKSAGIVPSNATTVEAKDVDADYNYTTGITGLDPETTYYYRTFVRQNGQDTYGETKEFKTKELSSMICSQEALAISAVSSKIRANLNLTDVQYQSVEYGFYVGESAESVTTKVEAEVRNGVLLTDLSSLTPSHQYFYQPFVALDGRVYKTEVLSFTTKEIETLLKTDDASKIQNTSAKLNAILNLSDINYGRVSYGFYYGASESTQDVHISGDSGVENTFSASLSHLSPKTQYWYKAYVNLDSQVFYGVVKTFTTDPTPVESITLDREDYVFKSVGNTLQLKATIFPADATDKSIEWSSDNEQVAIVDQTGEVTACGVGKATITATVKEQGKAATCEITVPQLVTDITLNKTSLSLLEGETYALGATVTPEDARIKTLTWTSSSTDVATVDDLGKITAVAKGTAVIMAEANDGSGVNAICSVEVNRLVSSIALSKTALTLYRGSSNVVETISAIVSPSTASDPGVYWTSSDTSVATVDNGVIVGVAPGKATILASAWDGSGVTCACEVEVIQLVTGIAFDKPSLIIMVGGTDTLTPIISPANANNHSLYWQSADPSIATVDNTGKVTGLSIGYTTIKATSTDGSAIGAICEVGVSGASLMASSSSTLTFTWSGGISIYDDLSKPYTISLYKDAACSDLLLHYSIPAFDSCWNERTPCFVFSGLTPSTTYWFRVKETGKDETESIGISGTTDAFKLVEMNDNPASKGSIILAEDFGQLCWGADEISGAAGIDVADEGVSYNADTEKIFTERSAARFVKTTGRYAQRILTAQKAAKKEPEVRFAHWAQGFNARLYIGPGYLFLGTYSYGTHLITPQLNSIPEGMNATLEVTLHASGVSPGGRAILAVQHDKTFYEISQNTQTNKNKLDLTSNIQTITFEDGITNLQEFKVILDGVVQGDRIAFGPTTETEKGDSNMMLISDMAVRIIDLWK